MAGRPRFVLVVLLASMSMSMMSRVEAERRPRARELGFVIGRFEPGRFNAITDVAGVKVGHTTLIRGDGPLVPGKGPVRTGVTAVIPGEDPWHHKLPAGGTVLNGCGELTGLAWITESGFLEVPVLYTNTQCVGRVMDGLITWMQRENSAIGATEDVLTPVVGECDDSTLNDMRGLHVQEADVHHALDSARSGPVEEGSVGAGTGMITFGFKGGVGTASRVVPVASRAYVLGALLVTNFGEPSEIIIAGRSLGPELKAYADPKTRPRDGSVQVLLATDAPVDARQLTRIARRAGIGLARAGHRGHHGSGDFALAFSTARTIPAESRGKLLGSHTLSDLDLDPLFEATGDVVEEAVLNSLLRSDTMVGRDGATAPGLPIHAVSRLCGLAPPGP